MTIPIGEMHFLDSFKYEYLTIKETFEYELALCNPDLELLITESMSNQAEIKNMMGGDYSQAKNNVKNNQNWDDVKTSLDNTDWEDDDAIREYLTKLLRKEAFDKSGLTVVKPTES